MERGVVCNRLRPAHRKAEELPHEARRHARARDEEVLERGDADERRLGVAVGEAPRGVYWLAPLLQAKAADAVELLETEARAIDGAVACLAKSVAGVGGKAFARGRSEERRVGKECRERGR